MKKEKFLQEVNRLKGTKTNLKTHKIMLSSVDVIREALDMTYFEDEVYDRIDEAQSKMVEARDIFRFDMASNLGTAEDEISFLKGKLDDLGVDYPTELIDFESEITDRESTFEEVRRRFQDMGYDALA
jgi:hypothetical protein|tara:strand:+ start:29 stop:412 length:384 start_codon:yes stop_codon:yes gene_type:complete